MRFVVITGMSGAGKTQALRCLEDLEYYVVDNLPPTLMPVFVELIGTSTRELSRVAVSMDVRSRGFFKSVEAAFSSLETAGIPYELIFLDANDDTLVTRYLETRRVHPLMRGTVNTKEAIEQERELLKPLTERANLYINTTEINVRELREKLHTHFTKDDPEVALTYSIKSFGFKNGLPVDADFVFDVRFLPNPFYQEALKHHSGLETGVRDYVFSFPQAHDFVAQASDMLFALHPHFETEGRRHISIAIGCTGGKHRSVAIAERVAQVMQVRGLNTVVSHRDLAGDPGVGNPYA